MERNYKYDAFISYRHISPDKEIADNLQKMLESYKPPKALLNGKKFTGWRIFRDETELPLSSNLGDDITTALEHSRFLIVVCSKATSESRWCMQEIERFKQLHNGSNTNIITLVADGNPEDVFPPALCSELVPVTDEAGNTTYQTRAVEPLAANVSAPTLKQSLKKLNTEFLRVAAPLLGCGYDDLYNREQRKKTRNLLTIGAIALMSLLLFTIYTSIMLWRINTEKTNLAKSNAVNLGVLSENLWNSGDGIGAIETALSALPNENNPKQPVVPGVMRILAGEIGAYNRENFSAVAKLTCKDHVEQLGYAGNGSTIVAKDSKSIYFWDSKTGALKKEYPVETFGLSASAVTIHFDDTGLYETQALYKSNGSAYIRNDFNYLEGYKREKANPVSLSDSDVLIEGSEAVYKLDGMTGEELWRIELDLLAYPSVTETNVIVSDSTRLDAEHTDTRVTVYDRITGSLLQELTLTDPEIGAGLFSEWVCITANRAFLLRNDSTDPQLFSFDISGNTLTNKKLVYSSTNDPLAREYSFTHIGTIQLIGDNLYLVKTHCDALEYHFITDILVFDAFGRQAWSFSYKSAYEYNNHTRLTVFDKNLCGNFCDILAVAKGDHVELINNETGDHIATYELDSVIKTSCVSRDGLLTVITTDGYEVAIPVRKVTSGEQLNKSPLMAQVHKFLNQHAMYACSGHSYAVINKNANDIYLYADVENPDFREYFASADNSSISAAHINTPQTHVAIDSYDRIDIYDLQTGQTYELASIDGYFRYVQFISDYLLAVSTSGQLNVYDVRTQECTFTYTGDLDYLHCNGNSTYFCSAGGTFIFQKDDKITFVTESGQQTSWEPQSDQTSERPGHLVDLYTSDTGKILFVLNDYTAEQTILELFDVHTGETALLAVELPYSSSEETLAIHRVMWSNDDRLFIAFTDGSIRCFDVNTGACTHSFQPETPSIVSVLPLNGNKVIGILSNDSILYKVRVSDGMVLDQVDLANDHIKSAEGNDYTQTLLVPERNILILSGWRSPSGVTGAYIIDLDTFDVIYDIEGYAAYYAQDNAFLVMDYSVLGSYPFYSTEQLVAKANQSIQTG